VTTVSFELHVNGKRHLVTTDDARSLLDVIREDLNLTGTKYGCGEGQCRACTVILDGKPVTSCITPARQAHGKQVMTIEGLAQRGALHPVQQAFLDEQAMQCGYCVPGMILTSVALLEFNAQPTDSEIAHWLTGNLCRCCGYVNIFAAVKEASEKMRGDNA
jgi:aerobic-type carbon monoxide dehydrogenase small subunit (CoxS/CutS family)